MISKLVKAAAEGKEKMPSSYDLMACELQYLMGLSIKDPNGALKAICMAYDAGFNRGHNATVRGRIEKKRLHPKV